MDKYGTIDWEKFAGLNVHFFNPIEAYYLVQLKKDTYIHGKIFAVLLKILKSEKCECLAQ